MSNALMKWLAKHEHTLSDLQKGAAKTYARDAAQYERTYETKRFLRDADPKQAKDLEWLYAPTENAQVDAHDNSRAALLKSFGAGQEVISQRHHDLTDLLSDLNEEIGSSSPKSPRDLLRYKYHLKDGS